MHLGISYDFGIGAEKDPGRAVALYQSACDGGYTIGCNALGRAHAEGTGTLKDLARAVVLYRQACHAGNLLGCTNLANAYAKGSGAAADFAQAIELYRQACGGGWPTACNSIGYAYGDGKIVAKDLAQAVHWYELGCKGGALLACTNLGRAFQYGRGVGTDLSKATHLYEQACSDDEMGACRQLSQLYAKDTVIAPSDAQAREVYVKSCKDGLTLACDELDYRTTHKAEFKFTGKLSRTVSLLLLTTPIIVLAPTLHFFPGSDHPTLLAWPIRPISVSLFRSGQLSHRPLWLLTPSIEPQYRVGVGWQAAELLQLSVAGSSHRTNSLGLGVEGGAVQRQGHWGNVVGAIFQVGRSNHGFQLLGAVGVRRSVAGGVVQWEVVLDWHFGIVLAATTQTKG